VFAEGFVEAVKSGKARAVGVHESGTYVKFTGIQARRCLRDLGVF
jgi:hypothetical protein